MRFYLILLVLCMTGCASTPIEQKRQDILKCVKDLKANDSTTLDAFEVCSKIYKLT